MKLTYQTLPLQLHRTLAPIYLISGEDFYLKNECAALIQKTAKNQDFNESVTFFFNSDTDKAALWNSLFSSSLINEKKIIKISFEINLPDKEIIALLQNYCENISPDIVLILIWPKLEAKTSNTQWFKKLTEHAQYLTIWPFQTHEFSKWLDTTAKHHHISFTPAALNLLNELFSGNLAGAAQAIEKCVLAKLTNPIDEIEINKLAIADNRYSIFEFINDLLQGDAKKILISLKVLRTQTIDCSIILWFIIRELRLGLQCIEALSQGAAFSQLWTKFRIFGNHQSALKKFLETHPLSFCYKMLAKAADVDEVIKGVKAGDNWQQLELFCLNFEFRNAL